MNPAIPNTMRAAAIDHFGGADEIQVRELPVPSVGSDEILIRVNDRLNAPNDDATLEALRPAIEGALARTRPGREAAIERVAEDPRGPFRVRVRLT